LGSAAVGAAAGSDLLAEAMQGAICVMAANTLLRLLVHASNQQPRNADAVKITHAFHLVWTLQFQRQTRRSVAEELQRTGLHEFELEVRSFSEDEVEIEAILLN
jgi:putative Mg2+ transporter-C (MgtC) family protein